MDDAARDLTHKKNTPETTFIQPLTNKTQNTACVITKSEYDTHSIKHDASAYRAQQPAGARDMIQATPANPPLAALGYAAIMEACASYIATERPRIVFPADLADLMRPVFSELEQEEFHALLLDTKHHVLEDVMVSRGLVDRSPVHAREVFRQGIRQNCARILLVHNHPSGDPTPSAQDVRTTKKLAEAGKIVGIEVLDHVVIGARTKTRADWVSLREEGLM